MRGFCSKDVRSFLIGFWEDESAATAIEYALIAAGIAMAIVAAINILGREINNTYGDVYNTVRTRPGA